MIREVEIKDVERICDIYNRYIMETAITFDVLPFEAEEMAEKIDAIKSKGYPYIVYTTNEDNVLGYAYCSEFRYRSAYDKTVEISVYLDQEATGLGIGKLLLTELLARARGCGYHTAISVISLPNDASVALHSRLGFRRIGTLKEVGYKWNTYVDTSIWQIML